MIPARAAFTTLAILILSGCSETPLESLTGCFSLEANGQPMLQVSEDDNQYAIAVVENGNWVTQQSMQQGNTETLKSVMGEDFGKAMASLVSDNKQFMLIRVDPETEIAGGTAQSGYLGSFFFGSGQIYRAESCSIKT